MNDLASMGADIKWVKPANLHLTLRFLGETPANKVEAIARAMAAACQGKPQFELGFGPMGAFPSLAKPRVVWIGLEDGGQPLRALAGALANGLKSEGFALPEEGRDFKAHLTMGRSRSPKGTHGLAGKAAEWTKEKMALPRVLVDRLVLFESRLSPAGPTYVPLLVSLLMSDTING